MEEIKVGEYVRLKQGYIGDVVNINDFREPSMKYAIDIQKSDIVFVGEKDIVKHSKNIIDIIEEGDYVNGEKVVGRGNNCILILTDEGQTFLRNIFEDNDIKSIVTKEQMKSVEYIVGDSNEDS